MTIYLPTGHLLFYGRVRQKLRCRMTAHMEQFAGLYSAADDYLRTN